MDKKIEINKEERPLMVTIRCITYNHESYIRQCLEGFIMQKTNFRFEAIVHDDASTDGTADIIREYAEKYPDIIKPIFETENQYSKHDGSIARIMDEHMHGKYVAMCEGDDYWTDPLKLQKQVDFLEMNEDYSMCFHNVWKLENGKMNQFVDFDESEIFAQDIIMNWIVPTCSVIYRKINLDMEICRKIGGVSGDFKIFINLSQHGRIHYMNRLMGVYRIHNQGATSTLLMTISSQKTMLNQINSMSYYYPKIRALLINQYIFASVNYALYAIKNRNFFTSFYFLYKAFTKGFIKTMTEIFSRLIKKFVRI